MTPKANDELVVCAGVLRTMLAAKRHCSAWNESKQNLKRPRGRTPQEKVAAFAKPALSRQGGRAFFCCLLSGLRRREAVRSSHSVSATRPKSDYLLH